jgi:(S)-citramalyl-CoA lyase
MPDMSYIRTLLFTPATYPERFAKAKEVGADGLIIDLEDGVALDAKDAGRKNLLSALREARPVDPNFVWSVRLNHVTTTAGLSDLLALAGLGDRFDAINLPKVESPTEVDIAVKHLGTTMPRFVAMIETGRGLEQAGIIAAHPAVVALAFGGADLAADLHASLAWEPMLYARSRIVQAAANAAIPAFDVPFLNIQDEAGLRTETEAVKRLGFSCKLAIHPAQVATINAVFAPASDELARAQRVVQTFIAAKGAACQIDGKMIDLPVYKAALRTVHLAGDHESASRPL